MPYGFGAPVGDETDRFGAPVGDETDRFGAPVGDETDRFGVTASGVAPWSELSPLAERSWTWIVARAKSRRSSVETCCSARKASGPKLPRLPAARDGSACACGCEFTVGCSAADGAPPTAGDGVVLGVGPLGVVLGVGVAAGVLLGVGLRPKEDARPLAAESGGEGGGEGGAEPGTLRAPSARRPSAGAASSCCEFTAGAASSTRRTTSSVSSSHRESKSSCTASRTIQGIRRLLVSFGLKVLS